MPRLVDRAPIPERSAEVTVRGERVRLRADQIVVWLTISSRMEQSPRPSAMAFPAILDTGHTHTLTIHERHLIEWAGLRPENLRIYGAVRHLGRRILLHAANIWVHSNHPQSRDRLTDRPPFPLGASRGIAVYAQANEYPRLPILGLRAIADNKLILLVNGSRRVATLRTAVRWWPFSGG